MASTDQMTVKTAEGDTPITLQRQATPTTRGYAVEVPNNRYELHDTQPLAASMVFFPPTPNSDRTKSNYDTMPPNASEDTIISAIGVTLDQAILATDAPNNIVASSILNALSGGVVQVVSQLDQSILLETSIGRFLDLKPEQFGNDGVAVSQSGELKRLDEVIHVPKGIGYRIKVQLPNGVSLPSDNDWATSTTVAKPSIRVTTELRGNNGR